MVSYGQRGGNDAFGLRTGDALSSAEISVAPLGGALAAPSNTMSLAPIFFPNRALFVSSSGRNVNLLELHPGHRAPAVLTVEKCAFQIQYSNTQSRLCRIVHSKKSGFVEGAFK